MNLSEEVVFSHGNKVLYTYDAAGIKLKKEVTATGKVTKYVRGFHYVDNTLEFVQTAEGQYVCGTDNRHEYHLKDHLGNVKSYNSR